MSGRRLPLGRCQKSILAWLAAEMGRNESAKDVWIGWCPSHYHEEWIASDRAVFSRALRTLDARGLIRRDNHRTNNRRRTTCVQLTSLGRDVAESLPPMTTIHEQT
jgi:hypothetical protein